MERATGLLVGGAWRRSGQVRPVRDRWSRALVGEVELARPEDVAAAVGCAADLARAWRADPPPPGERAQWLERAAALLEERRAELMETVVAETGFTVTDAATEVTRAAGTLRISAEEARRIGGEVVPVSAHPGSHDRIAFTQRSPVGVVCAVSPFNSPLNTVCHKIGPALAAGNAVVLKPSVLTPLSATLLLTVLLEAGVRPQALGLVVGSGEQVGEQLLRDRRIDMYTFTGSTAAGQRVKSASGLARVHLELGANSPTLVLADADLDLVADLVTQAGYRKAGQVCTSVQRLIVDERVADRLCELLAPRVRALAAGDPHLPSTRVGPLIHDEAAERVAGWIAEARAQGAGILAGGHREGGLVAPTLLDGVTEEMRVAREEVFGPVVGLMRVDSLAAAIRVANATAYGLQAGIFTRDVDAAFYAARRLEFGGVMVNDTSSYHADLMPYGGIKASGFGLEGPRYAVQEMTVPRILVFNLRWPERA